MNAIKLLLMSRADYCKVDAIEINEAIKEIEELIAKDKQKDCEECYRKVSVAMEIKK